jgi:hypothetical protein
MRTLKRTFALTVVTLAVTAVPAIASAGNLVPKDTGHTVAASTAYTNVSANRGASLTANGSTIAARSSQSVKVTADRGFKLFGGTLFRQRTTASAKAEQTKSVDLATAQPGREASQSARSTTTTTAGFGAFKSQQHAYTRTSLGTDGASTSDVATKKTGFFGGLAQKFGFARTKTSASPEGDFRTATHTGSGTSVAGAGTEKKSTSIATNSHTYRSTESTASAPGVTAGKSDTRATYGNGARSYETKQTGVVGPAGFGAVAQKETKSTPTTQASAKSLRAGRLAPNAE